MKNKSMETRLQQEAMAFVRSRKTLQLASLTAKGEPFASYAPFALGRGGFYVLLSELAVHGKNLQQNARVSILIVEDEDSSDEVFARQRVSCSALAEGIARDTPDWLAGIQALADRHGERIHQLSQLTDFRMFLLKPANGRFVKGFGRAYELGFETLL